MAKILKPVCLMVILALVLSLGVMVPIFGSFPVVSADEEPAVVPEEEVPALLSVRNLNITPVHAQPRQAIAISAKVVNEGGMWGSETVNLL